MWEYWIGFVYSLNRNYKVLADLKGSGVNRADSGENDIKQGWRCPSKTRYAVPGAEEGISGPGYNGRS